MQLLSVISDHHVQCQTINNAFFRLNAVQATIIDQLFKHLVVKFMEPGSFCEVLHVLELSRV